MMTNETFDWNQLVEFSETTLEVEDKMRERLGKSESSFSIASPPPTVMEDPWSMVKWDEDFWNPPPPEYFIPSMLVESQVGVIYAPAAAGKSLLSLDIVLGLTVRGTIFGIEVKKQPVLYIDREQSSRGLVKRMRAMGFEESTDLSLLKYSLLGDLKPLDTRAGGLALVEKVRELGVKFVVIDTMSKVVEGEENSNDTWNGLHANSMVRLKNMGVTVLQLDHTGKDEDKGQRGGSAKGQNADTVWFLKWTGDTECGVLVNKKDRDNDYPAVINLRRDDSPLQHVIVDPLPAAAATAIKHESILAEVIADIDRLFPGDYRSGREKIMAAMKADGCARRAETVAEALRLRKENNG